MCLLFLYQYLTSSPCNNTGQHLQTTPKKWNHQQHLTSRRRSAVTPRHTRTASRNVIKCGWHFHCVSEKYKMPRKQINRTHLSSFSHIRFKILYYSYTAQHVNPSNLHFSDFFTVSVVFVSNITLLSA